jgi:hypothetical protein
MYKILFAGIVSLVIFSSTHAQISYGIADPTIFQADENSGLAPDQLVNRQAQKKFTISGIKSTGSLPAFRRDSVICYDYIPGEGQVLSHKQFYEYDNSGNNILHVFSRWDAHNEAWINVQKEEYIRDPRGSLILRNIFHWDEHSAAWIHNHKSEYEYDADGMLSVDIHSRWDGIGTWNTTKTEHEYDAHGNTTLITAYALLGEEWVPLNKHEYDFDDKGNRLLYIAYNRDPEKQEWVYHIKDEREYDAYGNIVFSAGYLWNKTGEAWIDQSKAETEYEYEAGGKVISSLRSIWDFNNNKWGSYEKTRYEYDHGGRLTSLIRLSRDAGSEEWVNNRKVEYEYNPDGVRTLHAEYTWDPVEEDWVNAFHYEYAFDSYGNLTFITTSLTIQDSQIKQIYEFYYSRIFTLYFEDISASAGDIAEISLKTNRLFSEDNITSFHLDFNFDISCIEYVDHCLDVTLAMDGNILITAIENQLQISWTGVNPLLGEGILCNLRFRAIEEAIVTPTITGAFFNDHAVIIGNGAITISASPTTVDKISDKQIVVFPNPVSRELFVEGLTRGSFITIFDISGRQVVSVYASSTTCIIDVSSLPDGIYIIMVNDRETIKKSRFIKN